MIYVRNPLFSKASQDEQTIHLWSVTHNEPRKLKLPEGLSERLIDWPSHGLSEADCADHLAQAFDQDSNTGLRLFQDLLKREVFIPEERYETYRQGYPEEVARDMRYLFEKYPAIYFSTAKHLGYSTRFLSPEVLEVTMGERTHRFFRQMVVSLLTRSAVECTNDKYACGKEIQALGLHTPRQVVSDIQNLSKQVAHIPFPWVIKPVRGMAAVSVICNIRSQEELAVAIDLIQSKVQVVGISHFENAHDLFNNFLIESYTEGPTIRFFCVGGRCVSAYQMVKPTIIGNGQHTVWELIEQHPHRPRNVSILFYLKTRGLDRNKVLAQGETLVIGDISAPSLVLERIHVPVPSSLALAVNQLARHLDLPITEIEAIVPQTEHGLMFENMRIIDVNPAPDFLGQLHVVGKTSDEQSLLLVELMRWLMESPDAEPRTPYFEPSFE